MSEKFTFKDSTEINYSISFERKWCYIYNERLDKNISLSCEKLPNPHYFPATGGILSAEVISHARTLLKLKAFW